MTTETIATELFSSCWPSRSFNDEQRSLKSIRKATLARVHSRTWPVAAKVQLAFAPRRRWKSDAQPRSGRRGCWWHHAGPEQGADDSGETQVYSSNVGWAKRRAMIISCKRKCAPPPGCRLRRTRDRCQALPRATCSGSDKHWAPRTRAENSETSETSSENA